MLSNGKMNKSKQRIMAEISDALELSDDTCAKIMEVLLIKNKRNYRQVRDLG